MTWLKLSDDFNKDCRRARISDSAFRVHVEMLCFVMDDENGGYIDVDDVLSTSRANNPEVALKELIDCGFWVELGPESWQIVHQMNNQPDREVLERRRETDAERQRKRRRKAAGLDVEPAKAGSGSLSRRDTPRDAMRDAVVDVRPDITRDPGRVGTGLDGERQEPNPALEEKGRVPGWDACPACGSFDPCDCEV